MSLTYMEVGQRRPQGRPQGLFRFVQGLFGEVIVQFVHGACSW